MISHIIKRITQGAAIIFYLCDKYPNCSMVAKTIIVIIILHYITYKARGY